MPQVMTQSTRSSREKEVPDVGVATVVAALEFDILFGRLKPRERLVEDSLIMRFGARRNVIRRALEDLERMGVVVRSLGRGAAVRDFTAQEVEEVYELRDLLQARAVERMPLPTPPAHVEELKIIQRQHDSAVAAGDLREVDKVNDAFHRAFFSVCGSKLLIDAIAHYMHLTRAMRVYPIADPATLSQLRDQHWAMIAALEAGDRSLLLRLSAQHLQPSKAAYLAVRRAIPDTL